VVLLLQLMLLLVQLVLVVLFHCRLLSGVYATVLRRRPEHGCSCPAEQVLVVLVFEEHQVHRVSAKRN